jgi:hypothetical protein
VAGTRSHSAKPNYAVLMAASIFVENSCEQTWSLGATKGRAVITHGG